MAATHETKESRFDFPGASKVFLELDPRYLHGPTPIVIDLTGDGFSRILKLSRHEAAAMREGLNNCLKELPSELAKPCP